jgi:hypothetical protein
MPKLSGNVLPSPQTFDLTLLPVFEKKAHMETDEAEREGGRLVFGRGASRRPSRATRRSSCIPGIVMAST